MSAENVEIVRRIHDGWSRGDFSVGRELLAPDFEWHQHAEAVEPGSHRGAAIGGAIGRIFEIYEDFRVEPEEFIEAGDRVVVPAHNRGTARGSGLELDQVFVFVWTVRDGKLAELRVYGDRSAALEAAGLPGRQGQQRRHARQDSNL
ncbi:MAG: nuclear transport factor 2 family protein [Solirubrobacterales bacterium]